MNLDVSSTLTPFAARIYGVAVILAPLLLLAGAIAYIVEGEGINEGIAGGVIGVWTCLAMVIAFVGITRLLEPRAPRAAPIIMVVAILGWTGGVGLQIDALYIAMIPDLTLAQVDQAMADANNFPLLALLPWGWFGPLTFLLAGIWLKRTGLVDWKTAGPLIIGAVIFIIAYPARIAVLAVAGDILLVIALVPLGWAILIGTREKAAELAPEPVS